MIEVYLLYDILIQKIFLLMGCFFQQESKLFSMCGLPFSTHNFRSQSISIKVVGKCKQLDRSPCGIVEWASSFFLLSPSLPFLLPSSFLIFLTLASSCQDCFIYQFAPFWNHLLLSSVCSDKLLLTFRLSLWNCIFAFYFLIMSQQELSTSLFLFFQP